MDSREGWARGRGTLASPGGWASGPGTAASQVASIGGFAKRAHPARARYLNLNVNLTRRKRDLQPGGKEIEGGGRGGGGGGGGGGGRGGEGGEGGEK